MIEELLLRRLVGVPVMFERQPDFAPPGIVIERTGELLRDHVSTLTYAADCYGTSLYEAAKLCDDLTGAVTGLAGEGEVGAAWLETTYNATSGGSYRYKNVFKITRII